MAKKNNRRDVESVLETLIEKEVEENTMTEAELKETMESYEDMKEEYFAEQDRIEAEEKELKEIAEEHTKEVEEKENAEMKTRILDYNIRLAIKEMEGKSNKGIIWKQVRAITHSYEIVTGCKMSEERVQYIKKLNPEQAQLVSKTINAYSRYLKNKERAERFAEATN